MKTIGVEHTQWRIVEDARQLALADYETYREVMKELLAMDFELQSIVIENRRASA